MWGVDLSKGYNSRMPAESLCYMNGGQDLCTSEVNAVDATALLGEVIKGLRR